MTQVIVRRRYTATSAPLPTVPSTTRVGLRGTERFSRLPILHRRLLEWYASHGRALPWRQTRNPYFILVSEVMLQQTQVERVIPKYREFLATFPTLSELAAAPRGSVIRAWGPLGYNRRAVRLHQLANLVVQRHGGRLPEEPRALAQLPGVGPYTAAAVACFAFDQHVATLDTNVRRVIGRLLADHFEQRPPPVRHLGAVAEKALPAGRAADWNQALMDLGATYCTTRAPACQHCPLAEHCFGPEPVRKSARRASRQASEPGVVYHLGNPFVGSSRFYRGRIVEHLRTLRPAASLGLDKLGSALRADFGPAHRGWLLELLRALAADGLVQILAQDSDAGSVRALRVRLP